VEFFLVFLAGLTFSGHCLAMCGPFPAALRTAARGAENKGLRPKGPGLRAIEGSSRPGLEFRGLIPEA